MKIKYYGVKWLIVTAALLVGIVVSNGQGYVVEYQSGGTWLTVPQSEPGTKVGISVVGEASSPGVLNMRIRNGGNSTWSFNGALLGVLGDEGDFELGGIGRQVPFTISGGGTKTFTVSYDPTCPSDQQPISVQGLGVLDNYRFNVFGTALDSNLSIGSFETIPGQITAVVAIPDGSAASGSLGTNFGEVNLGGGGIADATAEMSFQISNIGSADNFAVGYSNARITGAHSSDFTITGLPSSGAVQPGLGTENFAINFNPSGVGVRTATFQVKVTDADAGSDGLYIFNLVGTGVGTTSFSIEGSINASPPNYLSIDINDDTPRIADGTLFPPSTLGVSESTKIRITNTGDVALGGEIVLEDVSGPSAFFLDSEVKIDPGKDQEFDLLFTPFDGRTSTARVIYKPTTVAKSFYPWLVEGTGLGPEIQVTGGASTILTNSANTPSAQTGTIFNSAIDGGPLSMSYTIRNIGNQALEVTRGAILGITDGPFSFSGIDGSNFTLQPFETRDFTVSYDPTDPNDTLDKEFEIRSNDFNENNFTFTLRGVAMGEPVMRVRGLTQGFASVPVTIDDTPLIPDQNVVDFGVHTNLSAEFTRKFRLVNDGTDDLIVSSITSSNENYKIENQNEDVAAPGEVLEFEVIYTPSVPRLNDNTVIIVNSNDSVDPDYAFVLTADVLVPAIEIYGGENDDILIPDSITDPQIANVTQFPVRVPNSVPFPRNFRVVNVGTLGFTFGDIAISTVGIGGGTSFSALAPVGTTLAAGDETIITVSFQPSESGAFESVISVLGSTDPTGVLGAGYSFRVGGIGADPDAEAVFQIQGSSSQQPVFGSNEEASIENGTDFGVVDSMVETEQVFTITNLSDQVDLDLGSSFVSGGNGFNLVLGAAILDPMASTTLTVTFDPVGRSVGDHDAAIRIDSNDPNVQPFFEMNLSATIPDSGEIAEIVSLVQESTVTTLELRVPNDGGRWVLEFSETLTGIWNDTGETLGVGNQTVVLGAVYSELPKVFYRLRQQ